MASAPMPRGGRGTARRVVVPYGWLRRVAAIARASGAQRSVCGADGRNGLESEQRSPPKVFINLGQSLSHGCAMPAPFAQGSLWGRGYGLPRRFAPRNDSSDPLSFRGGPTGRRGNPSFFTMDGGLGRRGRRPLRKVYRSPSNGPMHLRHGLRRPNFVPKFGASVIGIGPYGTRWGAAATAGAAL